MSEPLPGLPLVFETITPATLPCKASATERAGTFLKSSAFTEAMEPVRSDFDCVPYPTTTTLSSRSASSSRTIFNSSRFSTGSVRLL